MQNVIPCKKLYTDFLANKRFTMYHKNSNQGLLLEQISNYIKHAPFRRIKRSGSLGLSNNSVRNLIVFKTY